MFYLVKIPSIVTRLYRKRIWDIKTKEKTLYLSFDDGPHPKHTIFALEQLKKYDAKATFFCIGKNVEAYPDIYKRIIEEGHAVGNHTYNHLNCTKVSEEVYLRNVERAQQSIDGDLFRPPYGKVSNFLVRRLKSPAYGLKTVMWTVLSGDFDKSISRSECANNVILTAKPGSIVVFHDSEKAQERMRYALPKVLKYFNKKGYTFKKIEYGSV